MRVELVVVVVVELVPQPLLQLHAQQRRPWSAADTQEIHHHHIATVTSPCMHVLFQTFQEPLPRPRPVQELAVAVAAVWIVRPHAGSGAHLCCLLQQCGGRHVGCGHVGHHALHAVGGGGASGGAEVEGGGGEGEDGGGGGGGEHGSAREGGDGVVVLDVGEGGVVGVAEVGDGDLGARGGAGGQGGGDHELREQAGGGGVFAVLIGHGVAEGTVGDEAVPPVQRQQR